MDTTIEGCSSLNLQRIGNKLYASLVLGMALEGRVQMVQPCTNRRDSSRDETSIKDRRSQLWHMSGRHLGFSRDKPSDAYPDSTSVCVQCVLGLSGEFFNKC